MSIGRNASLNVVGAVAPTLISLITIPIYLGLIGEARYGVLAVAWLLLGYFGFFDLGLGRAVTQRIGALAPGQDRKRSTVFWSAVTVNLGMGLLGAIIIWPVALFVFGSVVDMDVQFRAEMIRAVPWLALMLPLATLTGVLSGALAGCERFLEINIIMVVGAVLFQVLPLLAVMMLGPDLGVVIPAVLVSRALSILMLFERSLRHVVGRHSIVVEKAESLNLLKFGGWVTVTSVAGPLMVILDRMIIGAVSGAVAVTLYTVPFQLAQRTTILASSLATALFPRFSGQDDTTRVKLSLDAQRAILAMMTPLSAAGILLIEPFLSVWISPDFANRASTIGVVLLAGIWPAYIAVIPYTMIQARGRPDLVAKLHLAELIPYFAMLYSGLVFWGLIGAATAFSIRAAVDAIMLLWFAGQFRTRMLQLIVPGLTIATAIVIATTLEPGSLPWFVAGLGIGIFACASAWVIAPSILKNKVSALAARFINRKTDTDLT